MRLSHTLTLTAMLAASTLVAPLVFADAEDFPAKDVQYVIPFGPAASPTSVPDCSRSTSRRSPASS